MDAATKRYLDLCVMYSTRPSADVAVWLRLQTCSGKTIALDMPDIPPPEQRRGWKALPGCGCMTAPGAQSRFMGTSAGVAATLVIRPKTGDGSEGFGDMDMLPLCELLAGPVEEAGKPAVWPLDQLKSLDLSRCGVGRSGILLLCCRVLASPKCGIETLNLSNQSIGATGAKALADAARTNRNLKELLMYNCRLFNDGGLVFANLLSEMPKLHSLTYLDLSNNVIPFQTCCSLETSAGVVMTADGLVAKPSLAVKSSTPIKLNTDGNRVFDEVLNAVSHGIAFILAIVGSVFLGIAVEGRSTHYQWSVTLYLISLCVLFLASTLYHSFFSLMSTRAIFSVIDHAAIYLLIAGSYTPILAILFPDKPEYSQWLLGFMWTMCVLGVSVTAILPEGKVKAMLSLSLYLGMGWVALLITGDLKERLSSTGMQLLVGGGLLYTLGVPFFVKNRQTFKVPDHTIWHMFVLAGAAAHYFFILGHIVPASVPGQTLGSLGSMS